MKKENIKEKIKIFLKTGSPVLLIGAPGLGKTAIAEQIAKEEGAHYFEFRLSQINPEDFLGVPIIVHDNVETALRKEWKTIHDLLEKGEKVLINFDELNRAPREVSNTAFGLINERRLGGKLDFRKYDNLMILATANKGDEDGTSVEEWDSALLNRFIVLFLEIKELYKEFLLWGEKFLPVTTSFLKIYKNFYYFSFNTPISQKLLVTPRTWEKVEKIIQTNLKKDNQELIKSLICPLIGEEASILFLKFLQEVYYSKNKLFISPDDVFSGKKIESEAIKQEEELNNLLKECITEIKQNELSEKEILNFINFFFNEENYNRFNQETMFLLINYLKKNENKEITKKFLKTISNNKNFRNFIKNFMTI